MDITIIMISVIIAIIFFSFSMLDARELDAFFELFIKESFRKKPYIYKVQRISAILAGCYSLIFAYYYYVKNIWSILIILSVVVYYISLKILLIVYEYIYINKKNS